MQAVEDIFVKVWTSVQQLADDVGEKYDTVRKWRRHGRIPSEKWPKLIEQAAVRGHAITAEQLMTLNAPMKRRGRPSHRRRI